MQNPSDFFGALQQQLPTILAKLQDIDADGLARQSGFLKRCPRKIPMPDFLKAHGWLMNAVDSALKLFGNE